jgi:hypothetical protein
MQSKNSRPNPTKQKLFYFIAYWHLHIIILVLSTLLIAQSVSYTALKLDLESFKVSVCYVKEGNL